MLKKDGILKLQQPLARYDQLRNKTARKGCMSVLCDFFQRRCEVCAAGAEERVGFYGEDVRAENFGV